MADASSQALPGLERELARPDLSTLRTEADTCKAFTSTRSAPQTVFGEGSSDAEVMFIGEQPGDREDVEGRPFVGPAGKLFDKALERAGIDRETVYVTNIVKHFKWKPRGKKRIHQKPNAEDISACRPWLEAEVQAVQPRVIICLGATAAQALLGRKFSVTRQRGEFVESPLAPLMTATVHPSSILRAPDDEARRTAMEDFTKDLEKVAAHL